MKDEQENKAWYQRTFNEVHASERLFGKVEAMNKEQKAIKKTLSKGVAAAALGALVFSNVISYAASGSPWILTITLPSGEIKEIEIEAEETDGQYTVYDIDADSSESTSMKSTETYAVCETQEDDAAHCLEELDGRIYLGLDENCRVDITDDFRDGACKGVADASDDACWYYEVTGTLEDHEIQAQLISYTIK